MKSLAVTLIVGLALLLLGCGQSTAPPSTTQDATFDFGGNWAAIDDGGVRIVVTVAEVDPGDYEAVVTAYPVGSDEPIFNSYKHGSIISGDLVWDGIALTRSSGNDELMLEANDPGAKVIPLLVHRRPPGEDIDWDSL